VLAEAKAVPLATFGQAARLFSYAKARWRGRALRRSLLASRTDLGRQVHQSGAGPAGLRARIDARDGQAGDQGVRGAPKAQANRDALFAELADAVADSPLPPGPAEEARRKAKKAAADLAAHDARVAEMRVSLFPPDRAGSLRVLAGSGFAAVTACALLLAGLLLLLWAGRGPGKAAPVSRPGGGREVAASFDLPADGKTDGPGGEGGQAGEASRNKAGKDPKARPTHKPRPEKDVKPIDLRAELKQAGFRPEPDNSTLARFVRFGTEERAKKYSRDQFGRIEAEKELEGHAEKVASKVYLIKELTVQIPRRQDFQEKGLFVQCMLGFRLDILGADDPPKPISRLYGVTANTLYYYYLTKQGTLRSCPSDEVAAVRRANGILYHPEMSRTRLTIQLNLSLDEAKEIARNPKDYVIDLTVQGLKYERAYEWGFFKRDDLLREDYDCDRLRKADDLGAADPNEPTYFRVEQRFHPMLLSADLVSLTLRTKSGKVIASFPR
jgi:hypothetical protein